VHGWGWSPRLRHFRIILSTEERKHTPRRRSIKSIVVFQTRQRLISVRAKPDPDPFVLTLQCCFAHKSDTDPMRYNEGPVDTVCLRFNSPKRISRDCQGQGLRVTLVGVSFVRSPVAIDRKCAASRSGFSVNRRLFRLLSRTAPTKRVTA
jgi:hypothetical protein